MPRPCPTEPNCGGCQPLVHYPEKHAQIDLTVTGGLEYLNWWSKNGRLPVPLVTTGPLLSSGTLGDPNTQVLFGDQNLDYHNFSGGRIYADFWHDATRSQGAEVNIFALGTRQVNFRATSDANGLPTLAVPFHDAISDQERVSLVSFPGAFAGGVSISSRSDLWGAEGNLLAKGSLWEGRGTYVWLLAGFRYLDLAEDLSIAQNSNILPGGVFTLPDGSTQFLQGGTANFGNAVAPVVAPSQISVRDLFRVRNQFYGGQVGFRAEGQLGDAFVVVNGKVALGGTEETLKINGLTSITPGALGTGLIPGGNSLPAGLFALGTNSGRNTRNSFAVVPELGIQVGYYLTPRIRGFVGYDYLYWSTIIRPGEQIDRNVNRTQLPTSALFGTPLQGPPRPVMAFHETDYWAHGVSVGFDFTY
jgi:hypothetical protein